MGDSYHLVPVDEFEALSIEVKPTSPPQQRSKRTEKNSACSPSDSKETASTNTKTPKIIDHLDVQWLYKDLGKYPAKTHARKVAKELGVNCGVVYLVGQEEKLYEDSDQGPEFRQRRYFYYITGADFPGCAVTYEIAADRLVLWIPQIEPRKVLWYGRTPTPKQCMDVSELDDVRYIKDLNRTLLAKVQPGTIIYALHPDQAPKLVEHRKGIVQIDTIKLKPAIERARVIKTDHEIALIRRANAVSSAAHKKVLTLAKYQHNEHDIQAIFAAYCMAHGAKRQAYPIIAASGPNASTLHYTSNDAPLDPNHVVVLDAGAEWRCYASDVTRTFPLSGCFPSRQADAIYRAVERMQEECIERVAPGVPFYVLHLHACVVAATALLELGILHGGSVADILNRGTVAAFFPHGLGHHVGLEVHDVSGRERLLLPSVFGEWEEVSGIGRGRGKVSSKREFVGPEQLAALYQESLTSALVDCALTSEEGEAANAGGRQTLEKNMVVTIEPGIYFCREYIEGYFVNDPAHSRYINKEELDKYWDVGGVRIEDDILVTDKGYENLTWAPKGFEMLKEVEEARPF
ncbi:Creatinase/aminopeptidase [Parathielavia appendiculata]|uniref:Xaa-Pro aminopeptidase n=1 Tax=Parathielavia appendiculata TaxID=2587402 RepID=A0AAN6TZ42_9PEZI|nr:Creatinase/aminopeptidase [Parathielavia appendiculata]